MKHKTKHHYFEPALWHQGKKTNICLAIVITACIVAHVYRHHPKVIKPTAPITDFRDAVASNETVIESGPIIPKGSWNGRKATQEPVEGLVGMEGVQ